MATRPVTNFRELGHAILSRTGQTEPKDPHAIDVPADLLQSLKNFKVEQLDYALACDQADEGRATRDAALERIGNADDDVEAGLEKLARAMTGEDIGDRRNPFKPFGNTSVSEISKMAYAKVPETVRSLADAVLAVAKPGSKTAAAAHGCKKDADKLEAALAAIVVPQTVFAAAMSVRDEQKLPRWHKALGSLKRRAALAWEDEPGLLAAVFAPPAAVTQVRAARKKKVAGPEAGA